MINVCESQIKLKYSRNSIVNFFSIKHFYMLLVRAQDALLLYNQDIKVEIHLFRNDFNLNYAFWFVECLAKDSLLKIEFSKKKITNEWKKIFLRTHVHNNNNE